MDLQKIVAPYVVDALGVLIFVVFWWWIARRNADNNGDTYDLADNIKDPYTNKASASALMYIMLGGLSIWWAVRSALSGGDPSNFIMGVLGIFVVKAGADKAMSAWRPPPPAEDPDRHEDRQGDVSVHLPAQIQTTTIISNKEGTP